MTMGDPGALDIGEPPDPSIPYRRSPVVQVSCGMPGPMHELTLRVEPEPALRVSVVPSCDWRDANGSPRPWMPIEAPLATARGGPMPEFDTTVALNVLTLGGSEQCRSAEGIS
jgi:hypothetical protein